MQVNSTPEISRSNQININSDFTPLSNETKNVLLTKLYHDRTQVPAGIKFIDSFAKKVTDLKELKAKLDSGKVDLGWKDRAKAVALCVGAALLVAAAVGAVFALFYLDPVFLAASGYLAATVTVLVIGAPFGALVAFGFACSNAHETFNQITSKQLKQQLKHIEQEKIPKEYLDQIQATEKMLEGYIKQVDDKMIARAGIPRKKQKLENKKVSLQFALNDIKRLHRAFEYIDARGKVEAKTEDQQEKAHEVAKEASLFDQPVKVEAKVEGKEEKAHEIAKELSRISQPVKVEAKSEGKEEKANEIAKKMLKLGRPLEEVCAVTGLSLAAVERLSRSISEKKTL